MKPGSFFMAHPNRIAPETGGCGAASKRRAVVLDPKDAGIERSIQRIERKSFIRDGVIPDIQVLLTLPAEEAKAAFLGLLTQYALVSHVCGAACMRRMNQIVFGSLCCRCISCNAAARCVELRPVRYNLHMRALRSSGW
jgi:hypothetical protein